MKKIIVLICITVSSIALFYSCQKNDPKPAATVAERKFDIEVSELNAVVADLNSQDKTIREWWERLKKWVNSHIGAEQPVTIPGQPAPPECRKLYPCGPCAGICLGSAITAGGENGEISQDDLDLSIRPLLFTIIEKKSDPSKHKLLIEIPQNYVNDLIMNESFRVGSDKSLPEFLVTALGVTSITLKAGVYPTVINEENGNTITIVNISVD